MRDIPLYSQTVEWMHYRKQTQPTKIDIANYWHEQHSERTGGAVGDALTDGAVFFLRVAAMAGLGKFVSKGAGRDTHLKGDEGIIATYATGIPAVAESAGDGTPELAAETTATAPPTGKRSGGASSEGNISTDVNINVEIHIAADAKPEVIRDIFRNMRRYVLNRPDVEGESK